MTRRPQDGPPLYQTPFGRAIDDAAGRIARALMLTVAAVGCAYAARAAQTWTLFTLGMMGTVVASAWVVLQFLLAYSAVKSAVRALPAGWLSALTIGRKLEMVLALAIVVPFIVLVAITASQALENVSQMTVLRGSQ